MNFLSPKYFSYLRLFISLLIFSVFAPSVFADDASPLYIQTSQSALDYRDVTTLGEFNRLVYKGRWRNIAAEDVLQQFSEFKSTGSSPALRDIWHDLLLSDFSDLIIKDNQQQAVLMSERLRLLNELGFFDEAVRLYQQASVKKPVPAIIAYQGVNSLALSGSADGACLEVTMAAKTLVTDEWIQDSALCNAYFGNQPLAEELYKKVAPTAGSGFEAVYKVLHGESGKAIHLGIPPLWRTLLIAQKSTISSQALKNADPKSLAAISENNRVPLDVRLAAASRAADKGTIGFDRLRKLYELKYPEDKNIDALITQTQQGAKLPQSDYYAAARFTFAGKERATIVKNALAKLKPVTQIKSQVYGWIVDKLTLQVKDLGWFAPQGYAVMIGTNRAASATMYYDAGNLKDSPFALVNALQQNATWSPEAQEAWKKAMAQSYKQEAEKKIHDFLYLANAYDQEKRLGLASVKNDADGIEIPTTLFNTLQRGGQGLSLITALNIFGEKRHLSEFNTLDFANIIELMTREGLFGERKKITLEFLIQTML